MLLAQYPYASVLATDTQGKRLTVDFNGSSVADSRFGERGFVARVYNGMNYSEYSFNELTEESAALIAQRIAQVAQSDVRTLTEAGVVFSEYPAITEDKLVRSFFGEAEIPPDTMSVSDKLARMKDILEDAKAYCDQLVDFRVVYEEFQVSKAFYSKNRDLSQSYAITSANALAVVGKDGSIKYEYDGISGQLGVESLDKLRPMVKGIVDHALELLDAERLEPGEYDVICSPVVAGLIAHEAFGHGVETDMFVKNRAKGAEYMGKNIASKITDMHDGATGAKNVASYLFDDEGTLGSDTVVIENGVLKSGISDLLSSLQLGIRATGNGRRESFERKAYARMTNTYFAPGHDKLEDMIASIKSGYLLENYHSGMEDPKNWGIQCVIARGREIKDGKLTGKVVSPVMMTGYVPDVLSSISMVSENGFGLNGSGYCGKGHKEYAKTSLGGTYIKLRGRLG
jgi:TldD protein